MTAALGYGRGRWLCRRGGKAACASAGELARRAPEEFLEGGDERGNGGVAAVEGHGGDAFPRFKLGAGVVQADTLTPAPEGFPGLALEQAGKGAFGHAEARAPFADRFRGVRLIEEGGAQGDEAAIARHAFEHSTSLAQSAKALVKAGLTTPEEAVRVTRREADDA